MLKHVLGGPGKTVIRAGYSIAYSREGINSFFGISTNFLSPTSDGNPGNFGSQQAQSCPTNNRRKWLLPGGNHRTWSASIPYVLQSPTQFTNQFALDPTQGQSTNVFAPNLKPPMIESWNAGIQRELTSNMVLEVRYQANHGVGLWDQFDLNEVNIFENGFLKEFQTRRPTSTSAYACSANCRELLLQSPQQTLGIIPKPPQSERLIIGDLCAAVGCAAACQRRLHGCRCLRWHSLVK